MRDEKFLATKYTPEIINQVSEIMWMWLVVEREIINILKILTLFPSDLRLNLNFLVFLVLHFSNTVVGRKRSRLRASKGRFWEMHQ